MKFSSIEEYGLRCLLRIAKENPEKGMTIPEISKAEGLSVHYTAKLLRILRMAGFLESIRGQVGGYRLAIPPERIPVSNVMNALGGKFYEADFCKNHKTQNDICTNMIECSIRGLWQKVQESVDTVLLDITLKDLIFESRSVVSKIEVKI